MIVIALIAVDGFPTANTWLAADDIVWPARREAGATSAARASAAAKNDLIGKRAVPTTGTANGGVANAVFASTEPVLAVISVIESGKYGIRASSTVANGARYHVLNDSFYDDLVTLFS
ncbi:MAG TPA: hypothetical protein VNO75_05620 [Gemmatimonadaceae bacterium]|nr:hypothetical protein [Gemmatimonadaceae bacterium]